MLNTQIHCHPSCPAVAPEVENAAPSDSVSRPMTATHPSPPPTRSRRTPLAPGRTRTDEAAVHGRRRKAPPVGSAPEYVRTYGVRP
ncbi:hypothetical protein [Streptomyces sp. NPDC048606]|uniref:hypothetical protein n=1 Tax=Streptomyces sp. NPDC048606 TaxID=3154726 RepID=UPI00341C7ED4